MLKRSLTITLHQLLQKTLGVEIHTKNIKDVDRSHSPNNMHALKYNLVSLGAESGVCLASIS